MPSTALKGLNDRLKDVNQLMAAHAAIAGPKPGRKYEVVGLNRATILMLSAHLEGFLEELLVEALTAVNQKLKGEAVTHGFHNPWPDRIDDLYSVLGMSKPTRAISWKAAGNDAVRANISALVRTRNLIAHGTTNVTVYKSEVARHRRYVEGFGKAFDAAVRTQVRSLTGSFPWAA